MCPKSSCWNRKDMRTVADKTFIWESVDAFRSSYTALYSAALPIMGDSSLTRTFTFLKGLAPLAYFCCTQERSLKDETDTTRRHSVSSAFPAKSSASAK